LSPQGLKAVLPRLIRCDRVS